MGIYAIRDVVVVGTVRFVFLRPLDKFISSGGFAF